MIIIEWIKNYINTPHIELTLADEALFYLAVFIISVVGISAFVGVWYLVDFIRERRRK